MCVVLGAVETDPEYALIVEANNLIVEIDSETGVLIMSYAAMSSDAPQGIIHKYARDIYAKRFPELENLVLNPIDFMRTIQARASLPNPLLPMIALPLDHAK